MKTTQRKCEWVRKSLENENWTNCGPECLKQSMLEQTVEQGYERSKQIVFRLLFTDVG